MSVFDDIGTEIAMAHCMAIERALKSTAADGPVYEDDLVMVERLNGQVVMTGKPFKSVFIYGDETECQTTPSQP
jgi:hypothetical protein